MRPMLALLAVSAALVGWWRHAPRPPAVAVFCGHRDDARFAADARRMGTLLANAGYTLVYGGGRDGLMGHVLAGVEARGGRAHGITVREYQDAVHADEVAPTLEERKRRMLDAADAVVVLPGGLGTLDELFAALARRNDRIGGYSRRVVLVDLRGYWRPLRRMLRHYERTSLAAGIGASVTVARTPDDALRHLG